MIQTTKKVKKAYLKELGNIAEDNFGAERFSKYFANPVTITHDISENSIETTVSAPYLGFQNDGGRIPSRKAKNALFMRFTVGGRGTLVRGSLDSVPSITGDTTIYAKKVKGFTLKGGKWDIAHQKEVLLLRQDIMNDIIGEI